MSRKGTSTQTKAIEPTAIHEISPLARTGRFVRISQQPGDRLARQEAATRPEPFVTAKEAASFLCLTVRRVLQMARSGQLPAHPLGVGKRHTWRFRLSELAHALAANNSLGSSGTISLGSPSGSGQEK